MNDEDVDNRTEAQEQYGKYDEQDDRLAQESFFRMNPSQMRHGKRSAQHSLVLERTWLDLEDDEEEFEDAIIEEAQDQQLYDLNAFLVSKRAMHKF